MIHKYYGIRDDREVRRGTVVSTLFALLISGGGYFIGSLSHLFLWGGTMPEGGKDYLVPLMLNQAALPNILLGVVLVLLISASVSTLSSITLTACSTASMDLVKEAIAPQNEGEQPFRPDPGVMPALCGGLLSHRQLPHPHSGNDELFLGHPVRLFPGPLSPVPILEGH